MALSVEPVRQVGDGWRNADAAGVSTGDRDAVLRQIRWLTFISFK